MMSQCSLDSRFCLGPNDVHVWFLDPEQISHDEAQSRCRDCLSADERARHVRFVFDRDRHMYLVARSLLRHVLSVYEGIAPSEWCFSTNAYGKPYAEAPTQGGEIRFNVTHTQGLVALAVAHQQEVGIDAEHVDRSLKWRPLVRNVLADPEAKYLTSVAESEQRRVFFRFWTLKEAYIKGCGRGLSIPLKSFWFEMDAGSSPRLRFAEPFPEDDRRWLFFHSDRFPQHEVALAVEGDDEVRLTFLPGLQVFSADYLGK